MKLNLLWLLFILCFFSCELEEFPTDINSGATFETFFGNVDGVIEFGADVIELSNGDYIVVGSVIK